MMAVLVALKKYANDEIRLTRMKWINQQRIFVHAASAFVKLVLSNISFDGANITLNVS